MHACMKHKTRKRMHACTRLHGGSLMCMKHKTTQESPQVQQEPPCNRVHACTRFRVHDYMGALSCACIYACIWHKTTQESPQVQQEPPSTTREPPCNRVHACTRFRVHDYMGALSCACICMHMAQNNTREPPSTTREPPSTTRAPM
jgi:hypothetical protein